MNNYLKAIIIALAVIVVAGVVFWLVGNQSGNLGAVGINRFPNSGIATRCLAVTTSAGTTNSCTDGALTVSGAATLGNLVYGQTTLTLTYGTSTPTSTLTAAQICSNSVISVTATAAATTTALTLPVATSTNNTCLTQDGATRDFVFVNSSSSSYVITITSSTGQTMYKPFNASSTFTAAGGQILVVKIVRDTSSTNQVFVNKGAQL